GDVRSHAVPAHRRAPISTHPRTAGILLVPVAEGDRGMTDDGSLIEFITSQRWYGSKTREVGSATVIDRAKLGDDLELQLVEVRFDTGTHETYQLLTDGSGYD